MEMYLSISRQKRRWRHEKMNEGNNDNLTTWERINKFLKKHGTEAALSIIFSITAAFLYDGYKSIAEDIRTLVSVPETVEEIKGEVKKVKKRVTKLKKRVNELEAQKNNSDPSTIQINLGENLEFKKDLLTFEYQAGNPYFLEAPDWDDETVIAKDIDSGKKYTSKQLINHKLLIPYETTADGEIVKNYFYGQYNNKNQWDGDCTLNVYNGTNDKLIAVLDATYENGVITSYKQIESDSNDHFYLWRISKRKNRGSYDSGKSLCYLFKEIKKDFTDHAVTAEDILTVNKVEKDLKKDSWLESYYCGNTSQGRYNDDTGKAYYIKFSEAGYVETLYMGNFFNGSFNDEMAQEIVYDASENANRYFYYEGAFKEGVRQKTVDGRNYVTQKQIDHIIQGKKFGYKLKWHETDIS